MPHIGCIILNKHTRTICVTQSIDLNLLSKLYLAVV